MKTISNIPDRRKGGFRRVEFTGTASVISSDEGLFLEEVACNLPEVKSGIRMGLRTVPPPPQHSRQEKGSFRRVESTGTASMVSIDEGQLLGEDACKLPKMKGWGWGERLRTVPNIPDRRKRELPRGRVHGYC